MVDAAPSSDPANAPVFLSARWHALLMLNYEIDPGILESRLPAGTELDDFDGRTYVSMVGFRFLETRLLGMPIPFHRHFDEVNLRFYVRRRCGDEWRRGVVFVKEIVPRWAIAAVARWRYGERYVSLPMRHRAELPGTPDERAELSYEWRTQAGWNGLFAAIEGVSSKAALGSEEEFITEHYWGYAAQRDLSTVEYRVEHPRWRIWRAREPRFQCDVAGFYGEEFVEALSGAPSSAFVADGSEVSVRKGALLR